MNVTNKQIHKIKMFLLCLVVFVAHYWQEFLPDKHEYKISKLKSEFNQKYELLNENKLRLLKIVINNYESLHDSINKMNIFALTEEKLEGLTKNIKIKQNIIFCKYSMKMLSCVLGPVVFPIVAFIFK